MKNALKIARLLSIQDTREYVEEGDRWVALAGTGIVRNCDRCERIHEVHAHVELEDGSPAIVGTGYMRADDLVQKSTVRSAVNREQRRRRLELELAAAVVKLARARVLASEVDALVLPPMVQGTRTLSSGRVVPMLSMGETELWCDLAGDRSDEIEGIWRSDQLRARLHAEGLRSVYSLEDEERRLRRDLAKVAQAAGKA